MFVSKIEALTFSFNLISYNYNKSEYPLKHVSNNKSRLVILQQSKKTV
jgi:hypothetical protein